MDVIIYAILVGLISIVVWIYLYKKEGFWNWIYPNYCKSCGNYGMNKCGSCANCGYCISPNGSGECVDGDQNGPYFRKDCIGWKYGMPITQPVYVPEIPIWSNWYVPRHVSHKRKTRHHDRTHM